MDAHFYFSAFESPELQGTSTFPNMLLSTTVDTQETYHIACNTHRMHKAT